MNRNAKYARFAVLVLLMACFCFLMCSKDMPTIAKNKTSNIVLNITVNHNLQRITPKLEKQTVITKVTVTITASDLETITKDLTGSGDDYSGVIEVPQGSGRTFSIEAKDANNIVQYEGSTTKDLNAANETIDITLEGKYPNAVTVTVGTVTDNSIILNWTQSTDTDFSFYRITRKETSGSHDVNDDKLVDLTTSKSTTSYTDTGLESGKTYYYKVWVVDTEMLAKSSTEVSATTTASEPNLDRYLGTGSVLNSSYDNSTHVLSLDWSVENNGTGDAGSFRIGWYLSDNTTITTTDQFLTYQTVSSLAAGVYKNVSGSVNLWDFDCSSLPSGTYYVGVIIDYLDNITESDETDNDYYFSSSFSYSCPSGFEFIVNNPVFTDIEFTIPGKGTYTIKAQDNGSIWFDTNPGNVNFTAETSGKTNTGTQVGEKISWSGTYDVSGKSSFTLTLNVSSSYFFLYLNHHGTHEVDYIVVNYGLLSERTDNITFSPSTTTRYRIGYYKAFTNSNVRVYYENTSVYTYWNQGTHFTLPFENNQTVELTITYSLSKMMANSKPKFVPNSEPEELYPEIKKKPHFRNLESSVDVFSE